MGVIGKIIVGTALTVGGKYIDDAKGAVIDMLQDTIEGFISGKRSLQEWAKIISPEIDNVITRAKEEDNISYVGGKLKFSFSDKQYQKNWISYELYFIDDEKNWKKVAAKSDVYASVFTQESLDEIFSKGEFSYEVEE